MKEAAEVNEQRTDMHMEKRTRDKTIRDALVRRREERDGEGREGGEERDGKGEEGRGMGSCCLYLDLTLHSYEHT